MEMTSERRERKAGLPFLPKQTPGVEAGMELYKPHALIQTSLAPQALFLKKQHVSKDDCKPKSIASVTWTASATQCTFKYSQCCSLRSVLYRMNPSVSVFKL